ncbi:MAG: hypothetical protein AMXMBFR81_12070 [Chthonomonas sp.]
MVFVLSLVLCAIAGGPAERWWDGRVEASLDRQPARKAEWVKALEAAPENLRPELAYLVEFLPDADLAELKPESLVENARLAQEARAAVKWGRTLPEDVYLDAVVPHCSVTEKRDPMRREFKDKYLTLVKDLPTPGAAGLKINEVLFKDFGVTYNTRRLRTDQNSKETIAQGMATCTGLSVMLVEACRAVGVPARVAGIHSWPVRGGNHTWVEIWDNGAWHYVGAAEPDEKGLNHAWFTGDAAKAVKGEPRNAIWAVTYRATGEHFPLAWNPRAKLNGENVTDRYTRPIADSRPRLMVEAKQGGTRVEAKVVALDAATGETLLEGTSLGPTADINLHLQAHVEAGKEAFVVARYGAKASSAWVMVEADTVVRLDLDEPATDVERLKPLLADRFSGDEAKETRARKLLAEAPFDEALRQTVWAAFKASKRHDALRKEFEEKRVSTSDRTAPYLWRRVGEKPADGWGLIIAMHGGGGVPKDVNDRSWVGMFERYYRDHPEPGGYIYLALRAPNDEWNGFYDDAIAPLVERLILQFAVCADVNPARVGILGASHGGYGAFVIGPKIPHRFAAVHASAAAQTPGETRGENLRNVRFTWMIGERDTAYERADRCQAFAKQWEGWKAQYGGFDGGMEWLPGVGHSVPDRDKVAELIKFRRNASPEKLVWSQSDSVVRHHYWLESGRPAEDGLIVAEIRGNKVTISKAERQAELTLWLQPDRLDLARPIEVVAPGGKSLLSMPKANLEDFCASLESRQDPELAAPIRVFVGLPPPSE